MSRAWKFCLFSQCPLGTEDVESLPSSHCLLVLPIATDRVWHNASWNTLDSLAVVFGWPLSKPCLDTSMTWGYWCIHQ